MEKASGDDPVNKADASDDNDGEDGDENMKE